MIMNNTKEFESNHNDLGNYTCIIIRIFFHSIILLKHLSNCVLKLVSELHEVI